MQGLDVALVVVRDLVAVQGVELEAAPIPDLIQY